MYIPPQSVYGSTRSTQTAMKYRYEVFAMTDEPVTHLKHVTKAETPKSACVRIMKAHPEKKFLVFKVRAVGENKIAKIFMRDISGAE